MAGEDKILKIDELSLSDQEFIQNILSGKAIPPLYSDIIAKRIFNPDVHADRLNFLLRRIAKDETIEVSSSAGNENYKQSLYSKSMITDIPSWLKDGRAGDLEIQKVKQDFIFTRVELYASDMLLLQYSVSEDEKKGDLAYTNVKEVILVVLMVESPKVFVDFKSDRYIHRFTEMRSDTGLSYPMKAKMIYVQLDKCLEQFKKGINGEEDDELQLWLAMIADVNDKSVEEKAENNEDLVKIRAEAMLMAQDKGVQEMLIQEKYDRMDWVTYGDERRREGEIKGTRQQMEKDARGMYEEGLKPEVIARIQGISVKEVEEILGLQMA